MSNNVIEGNPTKKFFIDMITRDISIEDAIVDLLDNSIDGANRINREDYSNLYIELTINENEFIIKDNCGGFSLETAQKYAFRFGRPDSAPKLLNNTVGRFGIGMKRSLFKIGKCFYVETKCNNDHFKVTVNVEDWEQKKQSVTLKDNITTEIDDWSFNYENVDNNQNLSFDGTYIKVSELNKEVQDLFSDSRFISNLANDIQRLLNFSLLKGLKIILNSSSLEGQKVELLVSQTCQPYYLDGKLNGVSYRIIAGLGDIGEPKKSGWYIYCNDRLVVEAEQSSITGWGTSSVRKWHPDLVMFRGIVYFDSLETFNLPLTTTKKGVDTTSDVDKAALPYMKESMLDIIDFLRQITKMGDEANSYRQTLCDNMTRYSAVELKTKEFITENIPHRQRTFLPPELDEDVISQKKNTVRISYDADKKIADSAKAYADANSYKELGSITFDYYTKMEGIGK